MLLRKQNAQLQAALLLLVLANTLLKLQEQFALIRMLLPAMTTPALLQLQLPLKLTDTTSSLVAQTAIEHSAARLELSVGMAINVLGIGAAALAVMTAQASMTLFILTALLPVSATAAAPATAHAFGLATARLAKLALLLRASATDAQPLPLLIAFPASL